MTVFYTGASGSYYDYYLFLFSITNIVIIDYITEY